MRVQNQDYVQVRWEYNGIGFLVRLPLTLGRLRMCQRFGPWGRSHRLHPLDDPDHIGMVVTVPPHFGGLTPDEEGLGLVPYTFVIRRTEEIIPPRDELSLPICVGNPPEEHRQSHSTRKYPHTVELRMHPLNPTPGAVWEFRHSYTRDSEHTPDVFQEGQVLVGV